MQSFFVSSTFKDMQGERDALHRLVMPRLRDRAHACGESVQFVDLRWGISTTDLDSEAGAGKILGVCLDEIRQCQPYMIVLLGERYGWMPPPALLEQAAAGASFPAPAREMSVTELEIQYGLWLAAGQLDRCIFCLREPVPAEPLSDAMRAVYLPGSEDDRARMARLREKICAAPGANVLRYRLDWDAEAGDFTGYDRFADALADRLEAMLGTLWDSRRALSWQERQREEDRLIVELHQSAFVGRRRELDELTAAIDAHPVVILEGEGGCGKSALMAALLRRQRELGREAEMFCCGNSAACMDASQLLRLLCWQLGQLDGVRAEPGEDGDWRACFHRAALAYEGPPLTLFIDAIDQLSPDQALYESWFVPPALSRRIRMVISTTGAVRVNPMALPTGRRGVSAVTHRLTPPDEQDLRDILDARFRAEHKQISRRLADRILENPCSRNLLGMEVIVRRLVMLGQKDFREIAKLEETMDGAAAIESYLLRLTESLSGSLRTLIIDYLDDICRFLDPARFAQMQLPLYILALTQHGFSPAQFERFAAFVQTDSGYENIPDDSIWRHFWDPLAFARMKRYLGTLVIQRTDGRIDFSHRLLREALRARAGSGSIAPILRYWLFFEPHSDDTRQENLLVLTRMHEDNERRCVPDAKMDFASLDAFFHGTIRDAGNLDNSDDPAEAAEGARQLDILKRSILSDLSGPDGRAHLNTYCDILQNAVENGVCADHYTVWFFGSQISALLEQQGEAEQAMAIQIMCCLLSSLHAQLQRCRGGDESLAPNWTVQRMRRFVFFHSRTMRMYAELRLSRRQGLVKLGRLYGFTPDVILEKGVAVADSCIAAAPDDPIFHMRKAMLYVFLAKATLEPVFGLRQSRHARYIEMGMAAARDGLARAVHGDERTQRIHCNLMLYIAAVSAETLCVVHNMQVFGAVQVLRRAVALCEEAWQAVTAVRPEEALSVEDMAHLKCAWGSALYDCALEYKKQRREYEQRAADLRCACYYPIRKDPSRRLRPQDREQLARLAVDIGAQILSGVLPKPMADDGLNLRAAAKFLIEKEGGYLQAQARADFASRWRWSAMLALEAFYYDGVRPAQCIEICERGIALLTQLLQEAKTYSCAMEIPDNWIEVRRRRLEATCERNRTLFLTEE